MLTCTSLAQKAFDSATLNSPKAELDLIRVIPAGEDVPTSNRQIVFKFNQPMVAIGQMQVRSSQVPISIKPQVECEWRWIETSSLACQLKRDAPLKKATNYTVSVATSMAALSGAQLGERYNHTFTTQRPKVSRVHLEEWSDESKPIVRVVFDQPVTRSSVLNSLKLVATDKNYESSIVLPENWNSWRDQMHALFEVNRGFEFLKQLSHNMDERLSLVEQKRRSEAAQEARTVWRIKPAIGLPEDASIHISLTSGLLGIDGDLDAKINSSVHRFRSLPKLMFLGVHCTHRDSYDELILKPDFAAQTELRAQGQDQNKIESCDPQRRIELAFSGPVSYATAEQYLKFSPDLAGNDPTYKPWSTRSDRYQLRSYLSYRFDYGNNQPYRLKVPETLKAFEQYSLRSLDGFKDELGRDLDRPIDMAFLTAHRKARLVFEHGHSVLEQGVDSELPAYVTNLKDLKIGDYSITTASTLERGLGFSKELLNVSDVAYKVPIGVRNVLGGRSGMLVGTLSSSPVQSNYGNGAYSFVTQVTPYQVHFKFGHFNSYVWVTDLRTGLPVNGAEVGIELEHYSNVSSLSESDKSVYTDDSGLAKLEGILELDPTLKYRNPYRFSAPRLIVKVRKGENTAFLPIDRNYESWTQPWPNLKTKNGYVKSWGTTAQGVYKAGETIEYKLYVRGQSNRHWVVPPKGKYEIKVVDPKGQVIHKIEDASLNEFGAVHGEFKTAKDAAVGWYSFQLTFFNGENSYTRFPMQVLVSDFVPASFNVGNDLNGDLFQSGDTLSVSSYAKMHAGGPYTDAQIRVTAVLSARRFTTDHPLANGFSFGVSGGQGQHTLHQSQGALDKNGEKVADFTVDGKSIVFGRLRVESAVRDDRGKFVAGSSSADYVGRDRFIGLKNTSWIHNVGDRSRVESLVVGPRGAPSQGDEVILVVERRVTKAARIKGAGNAYLTQYSHEWQEVSRCEQTSNANPMSCEFIPTHPGSHRVTASLSDSKGRRVSNQIHTWVVGKGAVVWSGANNNQVEIVADKKEYKAGDTAKFLIKNPFPGAQALITKERYGVLKTWQKTLDGSTPIVEVPIESDDNPGFYLSVVIASPRISQPLGDGEVDLGKPAFKMGYLQIDVRDDSKQIDIKLKTNKKVYKPRESVKVSVKAKPNTGKTSPMELAIVVLDEAVFDLNSKGEGYYDPYQGFNKLEGLGVANYNLLMRLVGRQRFEKKGANSGGGGGAGSESTDFRDLIKFVAHWNPSIELDKSGRAQFDFTLPDNLTGWRVIAMVVDKETRMGMATSNFKVNRPTELRPVMPNQLTKGDSVQAGFSVMNRTDKPRTLNVELRASGSALNSPIKKELTVNLAPYQREKVWLPLTTDSVGELAFFARAGDRKDSDAIEHHLTVRPRYTVLTEASYGTSTQARISEPLQFPGGLVSGVGGVKVEVSPSVIGNIAGAFRYMRDYPYACWEQRLSKSVAAAQYQSLFDYLPADLEWPGSEILPQSTLDQAVQFQASNGGMAYWINRDDYVSPYLSAYTALAFVWLRKQGKAVPEGVESKLHEYLTSYLRQGSSESQLTNNLSVRMVALAALAARGKVKRADLMRYKPYITKMNLFAKAHFLNAMSSVDASESVVLELGNSILSQSVQSGGKFSFNDQAAHNSYSTLFSSLRSNCAVLSSLLTASQGSEELFTLLADIPFKQVRSITQTRGNRDHWENTQENIFCMNALWDFSQLYEKRKPNMVVSGEFQSAVSDRGIKLGQTEFDSVKDESSILSNPALTVKSNLAGNVVLSKTGQGRFYYAVRASFAKNDDSATSINAGIEVLREYSVQRNGIWEMLTDPMKVEKGELVRVDLFLSTAGPRNYVVIDDPVPGGLEPVNKDLATSSLIDAQQASQTRDNQSWWYKRAAWTGYGRYGYSFYHKELRHEAVRFYSDYLPAGDYHLSYVAQVIANGSFAVRPLKVEEMYDPDVFGLGVPARLEVDTSPVIERFNGSDQ